MFGVKKKMIVDIRDTREHDRARDQKRDPARDRARDQYFAKKISARFGIDESVLYELFQECSKKFQKEMDVKFMI